MLILPRTEDICQIVQTAGQICLHYYNSVFTIDKKIDKTPVTEADRAIDSYLQKAFRALTPDWPIISEESFDPTYVPPLDTPFWLIDPLDGTKDFIRHNGQFAINVALIYKGEPYLGILYVPVDSQGFYATKDKAYSWKETTHFKSMPSLSRSDQPLRVVMSRSEKVRKIAEEVLSDQNDITWQQMGSSLKFILVAQGKADLFIQSRGTMPWDNAAGHILVNCVGGVVKDLNLNSLTYHDPTQPHPAFIVARDTLLLDKIL